MGDCDVPQSALPTFPGLDHVVVSGGTPAQWAEMSTADWTLRLDALAAGVKSSGAHWVTLLPHHGQELSAEEAVRFSEELLKTAKLFLKMLDIASDMYGTAMQSRASLLTPRLMGIAGSHR